VHSSSIGRQNPGLRETYARIGAVSVFCPRNVASTIGLDHGSTADFMVLFPPRLQLPLLFFHFDVCAMLGVISTHSSARDGVVHRGW